MKKEFSFSQHYEAPLSKVWEILSDPSQVVMEERSKIDKTSPLEWIDHTGEASTGGVTNAYSAVLDEATHTIHITTVNSKYKSESNTIKLIAKEIDGGCEVTVDYTIGTTAIFNIITMEVLGKKIIHHASNVILKNIKKHL